MDETKLRQLWQNFIIYPPKDSEEKRDCLAKLLDTCIWYFARHDESQLYSTSKDASSYNTSRYCIGNWLIHQFIIDLGSASNKQIQFECEYQFLDDYFTSDIGWKLLKSIYYFNSNEALLYNVGLFQLLVPILKQYLNCYSIESAEGERDLPVFSDNDFALSLDSFLSHYKFNEQAYLKTLNADILSPAKVKSWIKTPRYLGTGKSNRKKAKTNSSNSSDKSDCDSDEEMLYSRQGYKFGMNSTRLICSQPIFEQVDLPDELFRLEGHFVDDDLVQQKPTKHDIICTIVEILIDFVRYEQRFDRHKLNSLCDVSTCKLSVLIIAELAPLLDRLVGRELCSIEHKLSLLRPIKTLLIASTFTVCQTSTGVQLIANSNLMPCLLQLLHQIDIHLKEAKNSHDVAIAVKVLRKEFLDYLNSGIQILIEASKYLIHTKQFAVFSDLMRDFFDGSYLKLFQCLLTFCELGDSSNGHQFEAVYKIVDSLIRLQITLQYSQSLVAHKQLCVKRRHKKCDLTPLMVHHMYHTRLFGLSAKATQQYTCFISSVYSMLVNLIFLCSKQSISENMDKLVCHICNHLSSLIACCWSLKPHFSRLLHFAVDSERSNTIRSSIFNIIEFNIKNQRKNLANSAYVIERCNFCSYEEICEDGADFLAEMKGSEKSEGYLTDNGNSSTGHSRCKDKTTSEPSHCLDSNCLIASLSSYYISLLKSDSLSVRQTIFRHLLNLFSYLSNNSKVSLLCHIVFPVFQNATQFPLDVCTFVLRLLIFISGRHSQQSDDLNLLFAFKKADGFLFLKRLILNVPSPDGNCPSKPSESDHTELSLLGIGLLESLVSSEVHCLHGHHHPHNLLGRSGSTSKELTKSMDLHTLPSVSLLIDLFLEHFTLFKSICTFPFEHCSSVLTDTSLNGGIEFHRKKCFDISRMSEDVLAQLNSSLSCLLHLLSTCNSALSKNDLLRLVLVHDSHRFAEKLYLFFQQIFQLVLNEIKLFRLLNVEKLQGIPDLTSNFDFGKYSTFFTRIFRIVEQLLLFLLQVEPFPFNGQNGTARDICESIKGKLESFTSDSSLVNWSMTGSSDPIQDLLKMFMNIAFNSSQALRSLMKCELDDSLDLEVYLAQQGRTASFDSLISDNETTISTVEVDSYGDGYQADSEGMWNVQMSTGKDKFSEGSGNWRKASVPVPSLPLLRHIELCTTVIFHLSDLTKTQKLRLTQGKFGPEQQRRETDCILAIINTLTRHCRENAQNSLILFDNDFATLLMQAFNELLISSNSEVKSVKFAIFDLFVEICKVQLRPKELQLLLDLFKHDNADLDFLLSTTHKIFFPKHADISQPQYYASYPVPRRVTSHSAAELNRPKSWLSTIIANIDANSEISEKKQVSFKSLACALPFSSSQISNFHYSLAFWIYLDKISPLIDKFRSTSFSQGQTMKSAVPSKAPSAELRAQNVKCIHLASVAFNSSTIEMWFDYIYNRFVYRICKENNGRLIYCNENFVSNSGNILGRWNFVRVNIEQISIPKGRSNFLKISHSTNCSKDETIKLSYPLNLLDKNSSNAALLVGSTDPICSAFQYRLGNMFLFNQHLQPSSTVFLFSLGADFGHLHHLRSDSIAKENYFTLPKQLARDGPAEFISSMHSCISPSFESKLILRHLLLIYCASNVDVYFAHQPAATKTSLSFSRFYPQSSGKKSKLAQLNEMKEHAVILYGKVSCDRNGGIPKTIADSGGISLFLFMLCYVFELTENASVHQKAVELLLRAYESHYQHRFHFDTHYSGHQVLCLVLQKCRKPNASSLLRVFSQFSIDSFAGHTVILSSAIEVFLSSWRIWSKSQSSMRLFFGKLESLVSATNPYRNYNLAQLRRVNAFSRFLCMIKDLYINYNDNENATDECFPLESESLAHLIAIFNAIIDSSSDLSLFKSVFNCILILQKTEWLHINQTRASFYYLCLPTWPSRTSVAESGLNEKGSTPKSGLLSGDETQTTETSLDLEDWEIVSEMLDQSAHSDHDTSFQADYLQSSNSDLVVNQLLLLVNRFVDQLSEISLIDAIFEQVLCLDFLLVFINTPSDRVREIALQTYFKFYSLFYKKERNVTESRHEDSSGKTMKINAKTLDLLLLANQLYQYIATEEIVLASLGFLLDVNRNFAAELMNGQENKSLLRRYLHKVPLENFIPFLATLPKCISSIGFSHKVLQVLHRLVGALSVEQVSELQQDFGLPQALSRLMINLNSLSLTAEDLNKFTKDHVNSELNLILYQVTQSYLLKGGAYFFNCYANLLHYFSIMERKVDLEVAPVFRQAQVALLQAAFDCLLQLKKGDNQRATKADGFDLLSEQYIHILSGSDFLPSDFSVDYSVPTEANSQDKAVDRDLVKPKEALDRMKFVVRKTASFIICRDDIRLTQKEIYFQREVLFHLLEIVEHSEAVNLRLDAKPKPKNAWTSFFQGSKDFFKDHLTQMALFLVSPFQSVQDRIFSLSLLNEKTKSFEYIKFFIDRTNDNFPHLFEAFLVDLLEKGIKTLTINDLGKYSEEFPAQLEENFSDSYNLQDSKSLEHVLVKYKQHMNLRANKSESFYKSQIATWYDQIEHHKAEHELSIRKHVNKIFSNMLPLFNQVSESATFLNDKIIFAQHREKKEYIEHLRRESLESKRVKQAIIKLMNESLHEKASWFMPHYFPQSWAMSPFESRHRIRKKLERSFLEIDARFVHQSTNLLHGKSLLSSLLGSNSSPFSNSLSSESIAQISVESNNLLYTTSARVILFDEEIEGEILLKSRYIQFFASQSSSNAASCLTFSSKRVFFQDFIIHFRDIQELTHCRYELQNNALEVYLISGLTYLMAFDSTAVRDEFLKHLTSNREMLPSLVEKISLVTLTQLWRDRRISNFEYLTHLNKLSGRTSNDLMQYPVFPFVIADYQSDVLNLKDSSSFRIFSRPIAVQKKDRERHYVEQYNYIKMENERNRSDTGDLNSFQFVVTAAPYHYGSHYSNSGIVLHYLVRLPPYTQMFLQYQDKNFDIPDRTFHSIYTTWRLATEDSTNGFKELIPEFYFLPEFLLNNERFNLGVRQNGEHVDDVILPPWARNSARLFTMINRQALEANYVSRHLNQWIDLIFGYQQSGKPAVDAINVFHPATHFSSDLSKIEDDVKRGAIKTMIKTFGQMPHQLFNMPHPSVSSEVALPVEDDSHLAQSSMPEVIGLKWGDYVGSPLYLKPKPSYQRQFPMPVARLWALPTNDVVLLPPNSSLLVTYSQQRNMFINTLYIISYSLCTWSNLNSTIWIKNKEDKVLFTQGSQFLDKISVCESIPDYDLLLVGYQSGLIIAFPLNKTVPSSLSDKCRYSVLFGHKAAVTSISINKNYNIALSCDATGVSILWDMSKQQYIRTIIEPEVAFGPGALTCISDTLGDLAVVNYRYCVDKIVSSKLTVFTINGTFVGELQTSELDAHITSLCYSTCPEGLSVNAIATGLSNGAIKLWSSWDLSLLRQIKLHQVDIPIKSISYSYTNDLLYIVLEDNLLVALENSASHFSSQAGTSASSESSRKNFRILDLTPDHIKSIL